MTDTTEKLRALALAVALHATLVALIWLGSLFEGASSAASGGPGPIQASLQVSGVELERARAAIRAVERRLSTGPDAQVAELLRPIPSDDASSELPMPIELADSTALVELASMTEPQPGIEELMASMEPKPLEDAGAQAAEGASPEPPRGDVMLGAGAAPETGVDTMLEARYLAALQASARGNWDPASSPHGVRCEVRFTQAVGGKVVAVEFLDCPYDRAAQQAVKRALLTASMPYAGFESVFSRHQRETIVYCHPQEACAR